MCFLVNMLERCILGEISTDPPPSLNLLYCFHGISTAVPNLVEFNKGIGIGELIHNR